MISDPLQYAQAGELWEFQDERYGILDHYLILRADFDHNWLEYTYKVLHIESGDIVPDLIIDKNSLRVYKAKKVA